MTAYQFSQPWLSKMDGDQQANALEWSHLRDYLKGVDNGTIPLFNPNFLNFTINGVAFTLPVSIANGGTNSTAALANGLLMVSSGGRIVEIAADTSVGSHKLTSLSNGTATQDAAAFGQIKVIQTVSSTTKTTTTTTSSTFVSTNLAASITPTSSSNRVLVMLSCDIRTDANTGNTNQQVAYTVDRSGTNIGDANFGFGNIEVQDTVAATATEIGFPTSVIFLDSPATTSSRTYTFQIRKSGGTNACDFDAQNATASIVLMEVV